MRRRPGIGGLQTAAAARDQYRLLGENVAKLRTDLMKEQLSTFRSQLEDFARKHKNDIRKNPTFRAQFHEMCSKVGVDPLASNKGFWAELLGIGDFYYELGVQIVEICLATRPINGGLINLQELLNLLRQKRKNAREPVSEDDCLRAISKLKDQYRLLGENVAKLRTDLMKEQLSTFRSQLEDFARKHKNDIRKNPTFRAQFHEMCSKVGVDPLASNKGFWAELLGIGDFYYELGVQIVEICLATRPINGGLINLQELLNLLRQKRKNAREPVSEDDCLRAISKLKVLGSGFEVISVGKRKLIRSVPTELNKDHNEILELAQAQGFVTVEEAERRLSWSAGRAIDALDTLLEEGLAMIDDGHKDGKRRYWFPCVSSISSVVGADAITI